MCTCLCSTAVLQMQSQQITLCVIWVLLEELNAKARYTLRAKYMLACMYHVCAGLLSGEHTAHDHDGALPQWGVPMQSSIHGCPRTHVARSPSGSSNHTGLCTTALKVNKPCLRLLGLDITNTWYTWFGIATSCTMSDTGGRHIQKV